MRASFPLIYKYDPDFGLVTEPIIPVLILTKNGSYELYDFILDTGADCCIMPKTVAEDLGIDIKALPKICFKGIEGGIIDAYLTKITMKITDTPIEVKCVLASSERVPFILGRADIFDHFNILIDNKKKQIRFTRIK